MQLRIFTMPFDPALDGFDDSALQAFCLDHLVTQAVDHFYSIGTSPYWSVLVHYRPMPSPVDRVAHSTRLAASASTRDQNPALDLEGDTRELYEALRSWRNDRARSAGKPAYVFFTNAQLVDIARARPQSTAAMRAIRGIGDAKVAESGLEIVALCTAGPTTGWGPGPGGPASEPGTADVSPPATP